LLRHAQTDRRASRRRPERVRVMRGILLFLLGVPLPVILLLYLFDVI
jgi:hypothetical protein